jgi:hypothetical protein
LGAITRTPVLHLSRRSGGTLLETASMLVVLVFGVASKLPLPCLPLRGCCECLWIDASNVFLWRTGKDEGRLAYDPNANIGVSIPPTHGSMRVYTRRVMKGKARWWHIMHARILTVQNLSGSLLHTTTFFFSLLPWIRLAHSSTK